MIETGDQLREALRRRELNPFEIDGRLEVPDLVRMFQARLGQGLVEICRAADNARLEGGDVFLDMLAGMVCLIDAKLDSWFVCRGLPWNLAIAESEAAKEAENGRDGAGDAGCEGGGDAREGGEAGQADS